MDYLFTGFIGKSVRIIARNTFEVYFQDGFGSIELFLKRLIGFVNEIAFVEESDGVSPLRVDEMFLHVIVLVLLREPQDPEDILLDGVVLALQDVKRHVIRQQNQGEIPRDAFHHEERDQQANAQQIVKEIAQIYPDVDFLWFFRIEFVEDHAEDEENVDRVGAQHRGDAEIRLGVEHVVETYQRIAHGIQNAIEQRSEQVVLELRASKSPVFPMILKDLLTFYLDYAQQLVVQRNHELLMQHVDAQKQVIRD